MYILPFLSSFLIGSVLLFVLIVFPYPASDIRKSERHLHKKGVKRLGGIAVIMSFIAALLLDANLFLSKPMIGIMIAVLAILIVGTFDDFVQLNWKTQLFFQISLVIFMFIMGVRIDHITNPFGGILDLGKGDFLFANIFLVIVWMVIFMNSMNWIDGIDGLSGGITMIGSLTIFILSLKPEVNQPPVGIITAALAGSLMAFLIFNFNPSKIMAGSSGSMFFGFILAVLAIFAGTKIATALLVMTVPIADAFWVVFERIRSGQSIFEPDKRHLHHKLLELGWSQRKVCLFFYAITGVVAILALNTRALGKSITIMLATFFLAAILYLVNKKIYSKRIPEIQSKRG